MAHIAPLGRGDYERIDRTVTHLGATEVEKPELQQLACELLPTLAAQDVSLSVDDPRPGTPLGLSMWFLNADGAEYLRLVRESRDGHLGRSLVRRSNLDVARLADLPEADRERALQSEFVRKCYDTFGYARVLCASLATCPGESLGRLTFFREDAREFDHPRVELLQAVRPAFSRAVKRLVNRDQGRDGEETAVVNPDAQVVWMTAGFPFLWNTVEPSRLSFDRSYLDYFADGGKLGWKVVLQILSLSVPGKGVPPPGAVNQRYVNRLGSLRAELHRIPGKSFGYPDDLLRIRLFLGEGPAGTTPTPEPRPEPEPPAD
jgi:hypothetical protein